MAGPKSSKIIYKENTVPSDITHYARKDHIEELLERKFPTVTDKHGKKIRRYSIDSNNDGDHRVWAPEALAQEEKEELYVKADRMRSQTDPTGWQRYPA